MKRELPWQALMSLGVPLAFVNYREASVLLENGLEGGSNRGFWSKPSLPVPMEPDSQGAASSAAQWGHLHCGPDSWHLSACRWILTSTVSLFHLCLLDTVSSPLLQRALPWSPHFLLSWVLLLDEDLAHHCCLTLFFLPCCSAASMPSLNTWLHFRDS